MTLSACRTGLGETSSDGVNGMRRAFSIAGARNVLMKLWDIADEPTAGFMEEFTGAMGRREMLRGLSLRSRGSGLSAFAKGRGGVLPFT